MDQLKLVAINLAYHSGIFVRQGSFRGGPAAKSHSSRWKPCSDNLVLVDRVFFNRCSFFVRRESTVADRLVLAVGFSFAKSPSDLLSEVHSSEVHTITRWLFFVKGFFVHQGFVHQKSSVADSRPSPEVILRRRFVPYKAFGFCSPGARLPKARPGGRHLRKNIGDEKRCASVTFSGLRARIESGLGLDRRGEHSLENVFDESF